MKKNREGSLILSPQQVEERYGVAVATLANWRSQKKGPPFIRVEGLIKYRPSEVERWLESR